MSWFRSEVLKAINDEDFADPEKKAKSQFVRQRAELQAGLRQR